MAIFCLYGCSAERNNFISKGYHNTTAHFNAYFYAMQQIEAIEAKIAANTENNYGKILRIYPLIDSAMAASYKENVDETIKMAGIAIERHKNSRWVDDSWILAGRARFYSLDYKNAIETYKYVNKNGEDTKDKHEALIRLIRTFTDAGEFSNARAVSDYLDKEKLNKSNQKLLHLVRAYFYQTQKDLDMMVRNLTAVAPIMKKSEGRARIYFIIGQLYQKLGLESEAYNYYKRTLSSNPEYELEFHARLNMAQVSQLKNSSDIKASRKVFEKLLKDKKNKEFLDKIYYEWGVFEAKNDNIPQALDLFKKSSVNGKSDRTKGLAYYQQATIYYDSLRDYKMAQAYYDSTAGTLPRDEEVDFALIDKRDKVLEEFVLHLNKIQYNDSLLNLVEMDSLQLVAMFREQVIAENEARKEEEAKAKRQENRTTGSSFFMDENTDGTVASNWYFDNPSAVAIGQNEFLKLWGDRPLVDYWRISSKLEESNAPTNPVEDEASTAAETERVEFDADAEVRKIISKLPYSTGQQQKLLDEIEEALYNVGNIYSLSLGEKENAAEEFENLLKRFPTTEYEPEVLYQLYLIYKSQDNSRYLTIEKILLDKYPNSKFARLVENPNYNEESNATAEYQKEIYRKAYHVYDTGGYEETIRILNEVLRETEETYFTSHLKLLKIMATGQTEDISQYKFMLSEFIKEYPDSEVNGFAQTLLDASNNFEKKQAQTKGIAYIPYFDQQHYFVIIYPTENRIEGFTTALEAFNSSFKLLDLKTSNLILNEDYSMILVTEFKNNDIAMEYFQDFFESGELLGAMPNFNLVKFVISKDNFNIFYQSKALSEYLLFFEKHY